MLLNGLDVQIPPLGIPHSLPPIAAEINLLVKIEGKEEKEKKTEIL